MLTLRKFIACADQSRRSSDAGPSSDPASFASDGILRTSILGLSVAAIFLPSDMLTEDRVVQMNKLWDLLGEREALVVAVTAPRR